MGENVKELLVVLACLIVLGVCYSFAVIFILRIASQQ